MQLYRLYFLMSVRGLTISRAVTISARSVADAKRQLQAEFPAATPLEVETA